MVNKNAINLLGRLSLNKKAFFDDWNGEIADELPYFWRLALVAGESPKGLN